MAQQQKKLRKGLWSPEEDEKLYNHITKFGIGCWSSVPKLAGLQRCGKSCRLRWINYLRPDLKRGMFSLQEEELILTLHQSLGNRWAQIAAQMAGRTDNEIKNYWNSILKKMLIKKGIDPNTHQPMPGGGSADSASQPNGGLPDLPKPTQPEQQASHSHSNAAGEEMQPEGDKFSGKQPCHDNLFFPEFDGYNSGMTMSAYLMNDEWCSGNGRIRTSAADPVGNSLGASCWDAGGKLESVFPFDGIEKKPVITSWEEQSVHGQGFGNFAVLDDAFQQM